ncbi:MAG: CoA-binding protein [Candidatus Pacearchaeota archaeon]|jgi:acetyltransferase
MTNLKDVNDFLNPKTIALIGASNNPEKIGNILMKKLNLFNGKLIPINPNSELIENKKAYKTILDYHKKIDLVIIAIPAKFVPKVLKQCCKKNIKDVIIISAGFSEKKKYTLNNKLLKLEKKYKLNILGPNCFGIFNPHLNLDSTFSRLTPKKGNIAFLSQSGALWSYLADLDLGFSGYVSLGNMIDLDFADFAEYYNKDKNTKKIICYIERLKDGKKFIDVCKNSKKQIIVIKAGKTNSGKKAAISHTGSIATDYEIYKSAFKQAKVKLVNSLSEALNLKKIDISKKLTFKNGIILTNAGGAAALLTDELSEKGFKIDKIIDVLGTATTTDYSKVLEKLKEHNYSGQIIIVLTPQTMSEPEKTAEMISNSELKNQIIAIFLGEKSITSAVEILKKNSIHVFTSGV